MTTNIFKQTRENAGLSVLKLAAISNVSRPTIHAIEAGKYTNLASMTKVANALNKKVSITLID